MKKVEMKNNEVLTSFGNIGKVPTGLRKAVKLGFQRVINYGCGYGYRFHTQELAGELDLINYDPFVPGVDEVTTEFANAEAIFCNNVLNVIQSDYDLEKVLDRMEEFYKPIYITIYEGDRSGNGRKTSRGTYQRNMKAKDYDYILHYRGYSYKSGMWIKK